MRANEEKQKEVLGETLDGGESDADVYPLRVWQPTQGNKDPRMRRECTVRAAADELSATPTLPWRISTESADVHAYDLPSHHCAFRSCSFECESLEDLQNHLWQAHAHALLSVPASLTHGITATFKLYTKPT